jgi:hypothetical protein
VKSEFVDMTVYIDTSDMPARLRPFLEVYLEAVTESPVEIDGVSLTHTEVRPGYGAMAVRVSTLMNTLDVETLLDTMIQTRHFELTDRMYIDKQLRDAVTLLALYRRS